LQQSEVVRPHFRCLLREFSDGAIRSMFGRIAGLCSLAFDEREVNLTAPRGCWMFSLGWVVGLVGEPAPSHLTDVNPYIGRTAVDPLAICSVFRFFADDQCGGLALASANELHFGA